MQPARHQVVNATTVRIPEHRDCFRAKDANAPLNTICDPEPRISRLGGVPTKEYLRPDLLASSALQWHSLCDTRVRSGMHWAVESDLNFGGKGESATCASMTGWNAAVSPGTPSPTEAMGCMATLSVWIPDIPRPGRATALGRGDRLGVGRDAARGHRERRQPCT